MDTQLNEPTTRNSIKVPKVDTENDIIRLWGLVQCPLPPWKYLTSIEKGFFHDYTNFQAQNFQFLCSFGNKKKPRIILSKNKKERLAYQIKLTLHCLFKF